MSIETHLERARDHLAQIALEVCSELGLGRVPHHWTSHRDDLTLYLSGREARLAVRGRADAYRVEEEWYGGAVTQRSARVRLYGVAVVGVEHRDDSQEPS